MDTMIPDHDEAEYGDIIALLRHTYDVRADDVDDVDDLDDLDDRPFRQLARVSRRPNLRVGLSIAAAALVIAGAAGVFTLRDRDDTGPGGATTAPAPTTPVDTVVPTTPPEVADADDVTWFLPSPMPEGYELVDLRAVFLRVVPPGDPDAVCCGDHGSDAVNLPELDGGEFWIRPAVPGGATQSVSASAQYDPVATLLDQFDSDVREVTVHGQPANLWSPNVEPPWIEWVEADTLLTVRTTATLTADEVLAIAEASTVGEGTITLDPATLPEGFELTDAADAFEGIDRNIERFQRLYGTIASADGTHSIAFDVDSATLSLDFIMEGETERRVVEGVGYSIAVDQFDPEHVSVRWVSQGWQFEVSGSGTPDSMMAIAVTLAAASPEQAAAAIQPETNRLLGLPVRAGGVFADGTRVSVHSDSAESPNVAALCVESADPICVTLTELPAEGRTSLLDVFLVDGQLRMIGWDTEISGPTAEGRPVEVVAAASGTGAFVSIPLDTSFPIPSVSWTNGDDPLAGSSADYWIRP